MKAQRARIFMIRYALLAIAIVGARAMGQEDSWDAPPSMIIDKDALYEQHYAKKGYTILPDTLSSFADLSGNKFAVLGNTIVPAGAKVEIPNRCSLFFLPEGRITVRGRLVAEAKSANAIELSPMPPNDRYIVSDNPELTWQGIKIDQTGSVVLANVAVIDAVSGITSDSPCDALEIDGLTFFGSTDGTLALSEKTLSIKPNEPYVLDCREIFGKQNVRKNRSPLKIVSLSAFGALSIAGTATSLVLNSKANGHIDNANSAATTARGDSEEQKARDAIRSRNAMTAVSAVCATAALVTIIIPFGKN